MQVSKRLVVKKVVPIDDSKDLINSMDTALAEYYCKNNNYQRGLEIYRELIPTIVDEAEKNTVIGHYINSALQYAQNLSCENKYIEAIEQYRDIMKYSGFPITVYKNVGLCMKAIGNSNLAIQFLERFEALSPDKEDVYSYLADLTYADAKDYKRAIEYYEKALENNSNSYAIYNMLGHLYSTYYQDKYKEKQIEYLTKAYELAPENRVVVKNLAYVYGKFDEEQKADEYYSKLMYLNPTHSDLHAYGAYLVRHKRFSEGFKFLQHRFLKEDLNLVTIPEFMKTKKKKWNFKSNIENKTVLVHYEQGFGDSIMFVRFLDELKKQCKEVLLVVQKSLKDLFIDSKLGVDIYTEDQLPELKYDFWIPMMDLPIVCNTKYSTIPKTKGYLKVSKAKIESYRKDNIQNNEKIKIGIAYEGTLASKETDRDILLKYYYPLMKLPDVDVYCFQVDDLTNQMASVPSDCKFFPLGKTFKNWEDTACAASCMDLMVTTDNGVMNLCGALGVKTFGLFNKIVEWRWFKTQGEDIGWYKSIKPFQCPTSGAWEIPIQQVLDEVEALRCQKLAEKIKFKLH